jgi:hypothetical protein
LNPAQQFGDYSNGPLAVIWLILTPARVFLLVGVVPLVQILVVSVGIMFPLAVLSGLGLIPTTAGYDHRTS